MIDISHLRQDLTKLKSAIERKKFECDLDAIVELDRERRDCISRAEQAREGKSDQRRNVEIRKRIAGIPRKSCSDEGSRG